MSTHLRRLAPADVAPRRGGAVPAEALAVAQQIVGAIEQDGEAALRRWAERLGDLAPGAPLVLGRAACDQALARLPAATVALLGRTAERIARFAMAQRQSLLPLDVAVPGGRAGHDVVPVDAAGCYAPGGRYPLPSSVLMTAVTARVAGVRDIVVASPRPDDVTLAAAAIAGATRVLPVGGAQAIAAMAFGTETIPAVDKIVGPGNAFVNEAKRQVFGQVGIDQLAGPSEIFVVADETGKASMIATDLLAQAEHDVRTRVGLITTDRALAEATLAEVERQLETLPTANVAGPAWRDNGQIVVCADEAAMIAYSDLIAAEHLQVHTRDPQATAKKLSNYGSLFIGELASVVYSDKCCGTNHTLPTMAAARYTGGLWVGSYVKICTHQWLEPAGVAAVAPPAMRQSATEGMEGHRRAAALRV